MRAGSVDLTETFLPKAAADRQKRIVVDDHRTVFSQTSQTCVLQLAGNFPAVGFDEALDVGHR